VWALVPRDAVGVHQRWRGAYLGAHPARADRAVFFATDAGPGAFRI
jgi:hypothetical protein